MKLILVSRDDNDLFRALRLNRVPFRRSLSFEEAMGSASAGTGILRLADDYPDKQTAVDPALLERAAARHLRIYLEYPSALPGEDVGEPKSIQWERAVVASDVFAPRVAKLRILMIHGCRFVPVKASAAHIVMARVAGFDTAVYGLPGETLPILFEANPGSLLLATTKLSQFITARYAPAEAWQTIWRWILAWTTGAKAASFGMEWTPAVRPSHRLSERLPGDAESQAVQRGVQWFRGAKLFIHPSWQAEAERRLVEGGVGPGPDPAWPVGDGSHGMIEGASSTVNVDGSQQWRYCLRNDCTGEVSMAMAFGGILNKREADKTVARNLNDYIYFKSNLAQERRADPASASYGLVTWTTRDEANGVYYGDDNARSMMGTMATAALLKEDRWDEVLLKCLLANLRTTGPQGFRDNRLEDDTLQQKGWRYYWATERTNFAPHYESWLWACFLWAYRHTGFAPFLERARTAIRITMEVYPDQWEWANGMQQERARMLLPLAWLVRVEDTPLHRKWLRFMAEQLLARQDDCGAIGEELGSGEHGRYGPPPSNESYGTAEAPLIHNNDDAVCDLLYTTNFAFVGLHEASAATADRYYTSAVNLLADFLCRVQVRSESHPELDGGWFRAIDFRRWDYWASNADIGWGAWSIESGWTQAWITSVLAMRQMKTSLWDLTANTHIRQHLDGLLRVMLPDETTM